ncbi:10828_t:CDS:1 [Paraglomus brasilianum]|uniref:10828_t:CDS:1 n=1 Tax=Paraglomus brasilianum TaxID=144538 RepID=A0A9N9ABJ1_9GLOM|nr:10828_t:CDS:1 [Paraglomus brasilianum]
MSFIDKVPTSSEAVIRNEIDLLKNEIDLLRNEIDLYNANNANKITCVIIEPSGGAFIHHYEDGQITKFYDDDDITTHIVHCAKQMIVVMRDDDCKELYPHPTDPDNYRDHIKTLAERVRSQQGSLYKSIFEIGYCVTKDTRESWGDLADFERGCMVYYELIKLVVVTIAGEHDWRNFIKGNLFNIEMDFTRFKDVNIERNWPAVQVEIRKICEA